MPAALRDLKLIFNTELFKMLCFWRGNFPMNPQVSSLVGWSVGWLIGRSVGLAEGSNTSKAPFRAFIFFLIFDTY